MRTLILAFAICLALISPPVFQQQRVDAAAQTIVTQEGNCGFGRNVTAEGTYKKVSSRKPKFNDGGCC